MAGYNSCEALTLSSIDARCDKSFGGIKRILIGNRDKFTATVGDVTGSTLTSLKEIIDITAASSADKFSQFLFRRNTGSYTSTSAPDVAIGNSFATTEVNLQFSKAESKKRMLIQSLINAGNAVVIIEDMYGQYIYLGLDREVVVTNAVMQSGTAETDLNGFTLTLQDISEDLPYFIEDTFAKGDMQDLIESF